MLWLHTIKAGRRWVPSWASTEKAQGLALPQHHLTLLRKASTCITTPYEGHRSCRYLNRPTKLTGPMRTRKRTKGQKARTLVTYCLAPSRQTSVGTATLTSDKMVVLGTARPQDRNLPEAVGK